MGYFINSILDCLAMPAFFVGLVIAIVMLARAVAWAVERRVELNFQTAMHMAEVQGATIENDGKRADLERKRADIALVQIDPTRPIMPRLQLESGEFSPQMLMLAARYLETLQPVANVPQTLTYSPHYGGKGGGSDTPLIEAASLPMLPDSKKDFWQLYIAGLLPDKGFLLGHSLEDGSEVKATWKDLYSALIGGASGSGKSTLLRCILAQSALQGGRFMVLDKHYGSGEESLAESLEPLSHLMLTRPAATPAQMIASLKTISDIANKRLQGRDMDRTPLILVVDESTALLQRSDVADVLINTLGLISQETRKVCVYAMCIGQVFTAEILPSAVRNCFVSFISCRTRRDVARVMSGSTSFAQLAETLTIGQAVWMSPAGEVTKIAVPNTTLAHIDLIATKTRQNGAFVVEPVLTSHSGKSSGSRALLGDSGSQPEATGKPTGSQREAKPDARQQRMIDLFCSGVSIPEIIRDGWNGELTGGRAYQTAYSEVQSVLRDYMVSLGGK